MSNEPTNSADKKSYKWLLMPFGLLIVLLIAKGITDKIWHKNSDGSLSGNSEANRDIHYPPIFTPGNIFDMAEHDEDYISGKCKESQFRTTGDIHYVSLKNLQTEKVITWSSLPNRVKYGFTDKATYDNFITQFQQMNFTELPTEKSDSIYLNRQQYTKNDMVLVDYGYESDYDIYCVIAIRQDKVILNRLGQKMSEPSLANEDSITQNTYVIKSEIADVYESPSASHKTSMTLKQGKRVEYIETNGEYIKCKYKNDEGIPIEGYIMVNDVGRAR